MQDFDILHMAHSFLPDSLGTARRMWSLLRRVTYSNHFIVSQRSPPPERESAVVPEEDGERLKITRVNTDIPRAVKMSQMGLVYQATVNRRRLIRSALPHRYRLFHGHQGPDCALASASLARAGNVPFIYEEHVPLADFSRRGGRFMMDLICARLVRSADLVIVQTESYREALINRFKIKPEKVAVITNGVDQEYFDPQKHREAGRRLRLAVGAGDRKVVTYLGYLDKRYNGVDAVLKISQDKDVRAGRAMFVLAGDGPLRAEVAALATRDPLVTYLGPVRAGEVGPIYAMTDIFLLARPINETTELLLPLKLLEALAMGTLVIGSDLRVFGEVITHNTNGLLYGESRKLSLKDCLLYALELPAGQLGRCARETALSRFSWEQSSERLMCCYKGLIG
jgi:glycosyltransferase involved in cell wall biosynthesis